MGAFRRCLLTVIVFVIGKIARLAFAGPPFITDGDAGTGFNLGGIIAFQITT